MNETKDIAIAFTNDEVSGDEFINQFETCIFPAASFHHREHVRVVWLYLQRYSVLETLARFSENLKRFAAANGKSNLYHETITWSYVFLINERMERNGEGAGWDDFAESNPDLFDWKPGILASYYSEQTLGSELARKTFVFPEKLSYFPKTTLTTLKC
jgi:hypothetical protein